MTTDYERTMERLAQMEREGRAIFHPKSNAPGPLPVLKLLPVNAETRALGVEDWPYVMPGLRALIERGSVGLVKALLVEMGVDPESKQFRNAVEEALAARWVAGE